MITYLIISIIMVSAKSESLLDCSPVDGISLPKIKAEAVLNLNIVQILLCPLHFQLLAFRYTYVQRLAMTKGEALKSLKEVQLFCIKLDELL